MANFFSKMLLFVYGTLKKNFWNNHLLQKSVFVGEFLTQDKFCLVVSNGLPFVLTNPKLSKIKGEVYYIDSLTLKSIDNLERNGKWYTRRPVKVINIKDGSILDAELYFNDDACGEIIEDGIFKNNEK